MQRTYTRTPQLLSQAEFIAEATITKLVNHGRAWQVTFDGKDLGFADGTRQEALVQAHQREVNNALFANDGGAPDFLIAELPSADALISYPELVSKFPHAIRKMQALVAG